MKYAIYKKGRGQEWKVIEVFSGKYDAVVALRNLCNSLGGDFKMRLPVELWKVNRYYQILSSTKRTWYVVDTYPTMRTFSYKDKEK